MSKTIILVTGANQGLGYKVVKILATAHQCLHILVAGCSMPKSLDVVEAFELDQLCARSWRQGRRRDQCCEVDAAGEG